MNYLRYYGFTKEEYDSCRQLRDSSNLKNVSIISNVTLLLLVFLDILAIFTPELSQYGILYILLSCFTLLLYFLSHTHFGNIRAELIVYGLMTLIYSAGIGISIPSREEKAILLLVIIAVLPVLFIDYAWRITLYLILICVIYCIVAFQVKIPSVAMTDLYNVCSFGILSLLIQYFVNQKIMDGFVCRMQNEKLLQAYEETQQELKMQAYTDLMTGLYNRTHFEEMIPSFMEETFEKEDTIYLVMLDLDKFKKINDMLGHQKGDEVIIRVAEIIKSHLQGNEFATRLGGDEYMFILAGCFHNDSLKDVVKAISHEIHSIKVAPDWYASGSIGVTCIWRKEHDFEELYRITDKVLYEAKGLGGNQIVYTNANDGIHEL